MYDRASYISAAPLSVAEAAGPAPREETGARSYGPRMVRPHAAATVPVDDERRQLVKQLADLSRAHPPAFSAVVRRADLLERAGVGRDDARRWPRRAARTDYCRRYRPAAWLPERASTSG